MFAATQSFDIDTPKKGLASTSDRLWVDGKDGHWWVWDQKNSFGGFLPRLVPDANGMPQGFIPVIGSSKDDVVGYRHNL